MKQKIAILGATGSIGRTTLSIISENKNNFSIELLSINKNIVELKNRLKNLMQKILLLTILKLIQKQVFL